MLTRIEKRDLKRARQHCGTAYILLNLISSDHREYSTLKAKADELLVEVDRVMEREGIKGGE